MSLFALLVITAGINVDEAGVVWVVAGVWTSTGVNGTTGADTCAGWTDAAATGGFGYTGLTDVRWTAVDVGTCADAYHLYCFEQ